MKALLTKPAAPKTAHSTSSLVGAHRPWLLTLVIGWISLLGIAISIADDDDDDDDLWAAPGQDYVITDNISAHHEEVMLLYPEGPPDILPTWIYKQDGLPFAAFSANATGFVVAFVESAYETTELDAIATHPLFDGGSVQPGTLVLSSNAVRLNTVIRPCR